MDIRWIEPNPVETISHMGIMSRNILVMGQVEKCITELEGLQFIREFLHRSNYISNSKFDMIKWGSIELSLTPNIVLF